MMYKGSTKPTVRTEEEKARCEWVHLPTIAALGRQRQPNAWDSLASLLGELPISERPSIKKKVMAPEE